MSNRSCPLCFVKLPRASVIAHSDELLCASCRAELEVSRTSRVTAAFLGALAAFAAARFCLNDFPQVAWVLAVATAVLSFGFVSALYLFLHSELSLRPKPPAETFPHIHS